MVLARPESAELGGGVGVANPGGPPLRKIWEIEIIRGLAAVLVVIVHVASTNGVFPDGPGAGVIWVFGAALPVLFAITGFVLYVIPGSPLPARATGELRVFLVRRVLRLVPAYWVALTAFALYPGLPAVTDPGNAVRFYAFAQIYSLPDVFAGIGPAWTLCVDMTLYVFIAVLVLARRATDRPIADARFFGGLLAVVLALHLVAGPMIDAQLYFQLTHTLVGTMDWFLIGVVLALLRRPEVRLPRPVALALEPRVAWPAALVVAIVHIAVLDIRGEPWALVATPGWAAHVLQGLIAFLVLAPATKPRPYPAGAVGRAIAPLVALGTIAYGIYLLHRPLITWIHEQELARDLGLDRDLGLLAATFALTIPLAILSWRLVERPAIKLSGRLSRGGYRSADAHGNEQPPWRPGPATGAGLALVAAAVLLVAFPAALPRGVLLALLFATVLAAVYIHVSTERRD
ncbi:MAG TPA: acyltransferase, partial [Solirubrobacteraceae bacterium]